MDTTMIAGVLRAILAAGGGYIVGKGWVDESTATALTGAVLTIFTAVWSVVEKKNANKVAAANVQVAAATGNPNVGK